MYFRSAIVLLAVLLCSTGVLAQDSTEEAILVDELRARLILVQDHEAELKMRLEQLNYDLQPENIERYFASVGSTRPEELRESRRRQLQAEKDRVVGQLDQLTLRRSNLESAINDAQSRAAQQSSFGTQIRRDQDRRHPTAMGRRVILAVIVVVGLLGVLAIILALRQQRQTKTTAV